jgi:hypothetical protein
MTRNATAQERDGDTHLLPQCHAEGDAHEYITVEERQVTGRCRVRRWRFESHGGSYPSRLRSDEHATLYGVGGVPPLAMTVGMILRTPINKNR